MHPSIHQFPSRNMFQEKWIWNRRKMRHLHLISPQGLIDRFSSWLVHSFSSCKARTHQCPVITLNFQRECLFLDLLEFSGSQAEIRPSFSFKQDATCMKKYAKCVNWCCSWSYYIDLSSWIMKIVLSLLKILFYFINN